MTATQVKKLAGRIVLVSTVLLLCLILIINFFSNAFNPIILIVQLIPLAMTLPGQLQGSSRAIQWLCFVDLFFLVQGILLCFTPGRMLLGLLETLICLIVFFSAIIFIRAARNAA
ncbi:MAG: DUF2069 domain-containing protein [Gammaproteobacteria bacterium]|jgi:uncharacterized membrane protein|nr:DUF2069 domain-containing protein [Gammaproteobacteria bacterium]MBT6043147.1 DUF2069 domain-containing protein [Gammaproteobacteria bacterium]